MKFIKWLFGFLVNKADIKLENHDPQDLRQSKSSTEWSVDYYCTSCNKSVGLGMELSKICSYCGNYDGHWCFNTPRARRKIVFNNQWHKQVRYPNGSLDILDENDNIIEGHNKCLKN